jgi:3-oxoacyl-[acyl-carrier protein] reductase
VQRLTDQVAVVTGAARGIGKGIAATLAAEGAAVVCADIDPIAAGAAAADLQALGLQAEAAALDVRDRAACDTLAARVVREHGRIDILAANAGIYPGVSVMDVDDAQWDEIMGINVKGALHAMQACLPAMLGRGYGRIVLTSSITGPTTGQPGYGPYGASKAAMLGLMRSAAIEVATGGVTINAVLPGNVRTPGFDDIGADHHRRMLAAIPVGRLAEPEDIGWAVRFLASPEAGYITGQTLVVDGGQVLPESATDTEEHAG